MSSLFKGLEGLELLEGSAGIWGVAAGIGAVLVAPIVLPVLGKAGKPVVKEVIKQGILFYEKGQEALAEVTETWEDIVAEARYEVAQPQQSVVDNPDNPTPQPETIPIEG